MATLGFHASHELHSPAELLQLMRHAEAAGFQTGMCSDHLNPWVPEQRHSGFSFAWLGAALQATRLSLGTICCPVFRYHPVVVAQAAATLAQMFPDRFWIALGTGQALNEHVTGEPWPSKQERQQRVESAAAAMRRLWRGETVTQECSPRIESATLYSLPERPPQLLGAALTPETARWVGGWADGLLTARSGGELSEVVDAFREGGGEGKPMFLQSLIGYEPEEQSAWRNLAERWPIAVLGQDQLQNLPTPSAIRDAVGPVARSRLAGMRVSSDLHQHLDWIQEDVALGFDRIFLFTPSQRPERFLDDFGTHVLPTLQASSVGTPR